MYIFSIGKIAGSLLLFAACTGLGYRRCRQYTRKIEYIRNFIRRGEYLKYEIQYTKTPLPDAFMKISEKLEEPFQTYLNSLSSRMSAPEGKNKNSILDICARETLLRSDIEEYDIKVFSQVMEKLGYTDREMQQQILSRYISEQEQRMYRLMEELPGKKKICSSHGIQGGVFLVILFY